MEVLLLKLGVIVTSLISWFFLGGGTYILFRNWNKSAIQYKVVFITTTLFLMSTYNTFYEGIFLFHGMTLMSSLNSWILVLLTPLIYIYALYRLTGRSLATKFWLLHLALPGLLALFYIWNVFTQPIDDRITYVWSDIGFRTHEWWVKFRVGCILGFAIQWLLYVIRLIYLLISKKQTSFYQTIVQESLGLFIFCLIAVCAVLSTSYPIKILYNLCLAGWTIYLFAKIPLLFGSLPLFRSRFLKNMYAEDYQENYFPVQSGISVSEKTPSYSASLRNISPETEIKLRKLINESCLYRDPDLSISRLSGLLATNETYLSRYLNSHYKMSFPEWINMYRINEAESLLTDETKTITEISESVGYRSLSTFYEAFKSKHQVPPAQWRKKNIK